MNPVELMVRRRNVAAFQKADEVTFVIRRAGERTKTAAGGWVRPAPVSLPPQQGRIVLNKRRYSPGLVNAEAGDIPQFDYLLVGSITLDVQQNDEFTANGSNYRIKGIFENRKESTLAMLEYLGPDNRNG
jgi:hypothetical protein